MPIDFPNSPSVGTTHTVDGITWEYDGAVWNLAGDRSFSASSSAPGSPKVGDTWFDTDNGKLYVYYDNFWVNPASIGLREDGITTAAASTITYTNSQGSASTLARSDHDHNIKAVGAFSYALSAPANLPSGTWTKVPFNTKDFDVSNWYSTTTYTYTPQKAGYYLLGAFMCMTSAMTNDSHYFQILIAKNGSHHRQIFLLQDQGFPNYPRGGGSCIVAANGTDWFEIQAFQNSGAPSGIAGQANTENVDVARFWGHYLGS